MLVQKYSTWCINGPKLGPFLLTFTFTGDWSRFRRAELHRIRLIVPKSSRWKTKLLAVCICLIMLNLSALMLSWVCQSYMYENMKNIQKERKKKYSHKALWHGAKSRVKSVIRRRQKTTYSPFENKKQSQFSNSWCLLWTVETNWIVCIFENNKMIMFWGKRCHSVFGNELQVTRALCRHEVHYLFKICSNLIGYKIIYI